MTEQSDHVTTTAQSTTPQQLQSCKNIATAVYALQAVSFLLGVTYLVAVIVAYIKRQDANNTWLASHFRWQIRTFWFSLFWSVMGIASAVIGIGYVILFAVLVWVIYRIAKGWIFLLEGRPLYTDYR